jgi:hypothetical protein
VRERRGGPACRQGAVRVVVLCAELAAGGEGEEAEPLTSAKILGSFAIMATASPDAWSTAAR